MAPPAATITTAVALFVGTNLDDMVVLAVLNVSSLAEGRPAVWQIWAGQYIGMALLVGASLLAALGLTLLPESGMWLLGLAPLGLGLCKLVVAARAHKSGARPSATVAAGLPGIIGVTVANGGDNIAAYTPVFRFDGAGEIGVTACVFAVGVAVWCAAGYWLVSHGKVTQIVQRRGHWIVPAVFIAIGVYIFYKGGVFG